MTLHSPYTYPTELLIVDRIFHLQPITCCLSIIRRLSDCQSAKGRTVLNSPHRGRKTCVLYRGSHNALFPMEWDEKKLLLLCNNSKKNLL
jgi:hypothetical protein